MFEGTEGGNVHDMSQYRVGGKDMDPGARASFAADTGEAEAERQADIEKLAQQRDVSLGEAMALYEAGDRPEADQIAA